MIITYSQIPTSFNQEGLPGFLKEKVPTFTCITGAIEEHPTTGGQHIHVYLDTGNPEHTINDPRFFDWDGVHPNIKPVRRTPHVVRKYVIKDGQIIFDEGTPPEEPAKKMTNDDKWAIALQATSKDAFLEEATRINTHETITHFTCLQSFAHWRYRDNPDPYESCEIECQDHLYPELADWVQSNLRTKKSGRPQSLVLYGPSLVGKTLWARSLGKHAYFPGLFMLEGFCATEAQYAIFDDMMHGFKSVPNWKFWMGGQAEFVIGDKYMRKSRIKWGKPSIFIDNVDPRLTMDHSEVKWLEANCTFVHVTGTLCEPISK